MPQFSTDDMPIETQHIGVRREPHTYANLYNNGIIYAYYRSIYWNIDVVIQVVLLANKLYRKF